MAALCIDRPSTSVNHTTVFNDVASFEAAALQILQNDLLYNTLLLSQLSELKAEGPLSDDVLLAVLDKCGSCPTSEVTILMCPGQKGIGSTLYISAGALCPHTAQQAAQQLNSHAVINRVTTTAANTGLMAHVLPADVWQVSHNMNLMTCTQLPQCTTCQPVRHESTYAATTAEKGQHCSHQEQHKEDCTPQQQQLKIELCSPSSPEDTTLVLDWCSSFLAQVFHMPEPPAQAQLSAMVLPRLQCGLYSVLRDSCQAVCMISHVPTSSSSTRITMLYTPEELRARGYGRVAVTELCRHLQQQGYQDICLLADTDQPGVKRLYQACGFVTVGELQMLTRC